MQKRQQDVASRLEEARLKLADAENMAAEYQQKLKSMDEQHDDWLRETREEVEQEKAELLKKARLEIESYQKRWRDAVESEKKAFVRNVETQIADKIILLAGKIVEELSNHNLEDQSINKFLETLQTLSEEDRQKIDDINRQSPMTELTVISSFPLDGAAKQKILDQLQYLFQDTVTYRFVISADHGFGIEIRTGEWQLGWNTKAIMADLKSQLVEILDKHALQNENDPETTS